MVLQAWDYVPLDEVYSDGKIKGQKYDVRFAALENMAEGFKRIEPIENQLVRNLDEAKVVYKKYVDQGLEGIILKNRDSYWENKRSKNLIKFKEVIDIALEVVGYYEHSKDPNKLGGVELVSRCRRITTDCGSGFKDTTHKTVDGVKVLIPLDERHDLDRERTTTAFTTSPFLTTPPGVASLTEATMISPMFAYLLVDPPITRMQSNSFAPVLSATLSLLSC